MKNASLIAQLERETRDTSVDVSRRKYSQSTPQLTRVLVKDSIRGGVHRTYSMTLQKRIMIYQIPFRTMNNDSRLAQCNLYTQIPSY